MEMETSSAGYSPLNSRPKEVGNIGLLPTERTQHPKRLALDELSDDDIQERKSQRMGASFDVSTFPPCVAFLIVDDTAVLVATREDAEVKQKLAVTTPCESPLEPGFTEEAKERMVDKMKSIKGFDAYDEIPNEHCRRDYLAMLSVALVGSRGERRVKYVVALSRADVSNKEGILTTPSHQRLLLSLFALLSCCHCQNVRL